MLNSNEKRLLNILGIVILLCICGMFLFFKGQELDSTEKKITQTIKSIKSSILNIDDEAELPNKIRELEVMIEKEKTRFYQPEEISISEFAQNMESLIKGNGLTLDRYKPVVEKDRTYYEYNLEGNAIQTMNLLKAIHDNPKYLTVQEMLIKSPKLNGLADVTMKVTYEVFNTLGTDKK
ncbi:MAG: hypothetical protein JXR70_06220 [Spirochaetales bacterium]|nr:hypothetical protein [Spirochaetales bacterium]